MVRGRTEEGWMGVGEATPRALAGGFAGNTRAATLMASASRLLNAARRVVCDMTSFVSAGMGTERYDRCRSWPRMIPRWRAVSRSINTRRACSGYSPEARVARASGKGT